MDGEEFGPWLGRQLRRREMSQAELAQRLGLTRAAVSAWITGRAQPRTDIVREIAAVLETDVATVHTRTTDAVGSRPIGWYHRPAHADGGREFGNAAAFAFDADFAVLARETTQNSIDERLDHEQPVRMRFVLHELSGEHLASFLRALKWQDLEGHYRSACQSRHKVGRVLADGLHRMRQTGSLLLLRVDDYNASGLTGPEYEDGRFAAVVRRQLDSHKSNERAGGSYGLGKATLWAASRLGLVLINSTLSETHEGRTARRIIGRLDLPWREVDGDTYAGPAWLGEPDTEPGYEGVSRSWWGDPETAADLWLERGSADPGTSFLVVGAHDAAGDSDSLQDMHDKLDAALADNFWAAMTSGRSAGALLEASVCTMRNGSVIIPEHRVDPRKRHPALNRALQAYLDGDTVSEITAPDHVVRVQVPLKVPLLRNASGSRNGVEHEAVLLITPAADTDQLHSRLVCMRGSRMTVMNRRPRDLGMGVDPFQAVLLAGYATGEESDDVEAAEAFLRASEPPEHDRWDRTEELTSMYARGALARIAEFRSAMDTALRGVVGRRTTTDRGGPEVLRNLLRLDTPATGASRSEGHPSVRSVEGEIDGSGAWSVRVSLKIPSREDPWLLTPVAKFDVRSGGRPTLRWAQLTALENCRISSGIVVTDSGVRHAIFSGITAPASHPVTATMAGVTVDVRKARGTSA